MQSIQFLYAEIFKCNIYERLTDTFGCLIICFLGKASKRMNQFFEGVFTGVVLYLQCIVSQTVVHGILGVCMSHVNQRRSMNYYYVLLLGWVIFIKGSHNNFYYNLRDPAEEILRKH